MDEERNHLDDRFRQLVGEIRLSAEIEKKGEEMKPYVLQQVNRRIDRQKRSRQILRIASMAASLFILLGITGHYAYRKGFNAVNNQWVEMFNPLGMLSTITLPDGTKVTLNAGTTIAYPNAFISKNREVSLTGEAFFEVTSDASHPFVVKADDVRVEVLGTEFNVKAYAEDERVEVSLSEGKVRVQDQNRGTPVYLTPGEQAYYDKETAKLTSRAVNLAHYISWKEGQYYFKALPLKEITRQLERIFNIRILIASADLGNIILTGDFTRGENLEQILRVITADKRLKYRKDEELIYYIEAR